MGSARVFMNQNPLIFEFPDNAGGGLDVSQFPGNDLGEKIIAADAQLGNTPGGLFIKDGIYTWSTHVLNMHPDRVITFGGCIIHCIGADPFTNPYPGPMLTLADNSQVIGSGEATIFDEPDSSVVFATVEGANVTLRDFTIQNIANGEPLQLGTSLPNIGINNGVNWRVKNINFKDTRSLSISVGNDSSGGGHANGVWISYCLFDGVKCITLAAVNAKNFHYEKNTFMNVGARGPSAPYQAIVCIDIEPNALTDLVQNFVIAGNIFDLGNNHGGNAILVQGAGIGRGGVVANNQILAYGASSGSGPTSGIVINGQRDVQVVGNNIIGQFSQVSLQVNGGDSVVLAANKIRSSGGQGSGFRAVNIGIGAAHTRVTDNDIVVEPGYDQGWAAIIEDVSCVDTQVVGNSLFGGNVADNPAPLIEVSGAGSVKYNNFYNGVLGDASGPPGFDSVAFCVAAAPALSAGNRTLGQLFMPLAAARVSGIRFFWNSGAAATIDCTLYSAAGAVLATASVTTSGVGVYVATFGSLVPLAAYAQTWAAFRESSGTSYQGGADATPAPALPVMAGSGFVTIRNAYSAGAAMPATDAATVRYGVAPVLSIP